MFVLSLLKKLVTTKKNLYDLIIKIALCCFLSINLKPKTVHRNSTLPSVLFSTQLILKRFTITNKKSVVTK